MSFHFFQIVKVILRDSLSDVWALFEPISVEWELGGCRLTVWWMGGLLMFMTGSLGSAGVVGWCQGGGSEDARGARGGPRESSLQLGHSPTKAKQANF